ncbi:lipopolysaccharide transport periplasmic protein LptA [Aliidiomarina shirensis]|uniref:Lipopolysaccharide transport periplasmic protein LptA n=1 Tax=Aliidiomarina shirensis TaxID=1048642 RepID=A0A432WUZ0_9GAMM|nr:lipopolysaccharide transport periplasmic protein LptA [Aliidiomarina shirensis]RUO37578.1 lipopolysaccharide transport periplasmic protein LptA [Aliidiomarina shirensis]
MLKPFTTLALLALSIGVSATNEVNANALSASAITNAQESTLARDFAEPMRILADNDLLDLAENVYRATGNVRITQGSLKITAHTLAVTGFENDRGEQELFILEGNDDAPATYEQEIQPDVIVNAHANRIEYDATERVLKLIGAAELNQDGNSVRAETITYYVETMQVSATRGEEQVETIFRPRQRTEDEQN